MVPTRPLITLEILLTILVTTILIL
jgi:hypothetical protein